MSDRAAAGNEVLLEVRDLVKHYPTQQGWFGRAGGKVHAVDRVSFSITSGETLGLVGESGCGKSTTGKLILRLQDPTEGQIVWRGRRIDQLGAAEMRPVRRELQAVFQDPYSSLNPRIRASDIVAEPLRNFESMSAAVGRERVAQLFERVGLRADQMVKFPFEFSGGQRQRLGIARALSVGPKLIVCDEPVSALDVSVQAQVINLLMDLQQEMHLSYLFVAHDLAVVEHISHRVAVMYLGKIVEIAPKKEIFTRPQHPYTEALLGSIPLLPVSSPYTFIPVEMMSPAGLCVATRARTPTAVPAIEAFRPELILLSAGFDAHAEDPIADLACTEKAYGL